MALSSNDTLASSTRSWPWFVTRVAPSICLANSLTSATDLAIRTPPLSPADGSLNLPLPRPPAWIWLFTTQIGPGKDLAAASASPDFSTGTPREIGTPNSCSRAFAWYSWIFIETLPKPFCGELHSSPDFRLAYHIPRELQPLTRGFGLSA